MTLSNLPRILPALAAALLAACAPKPVVFRCEGGVRLDARFRKDSVTVGMPDKTVTLPRTMSGSGARYSDGALVFWNKGNTAFVEKGERLLYRDCVTP